MDNGSVKLKISTFTHSYSMIQRPKDFILFIHLKSEMHRSFSSNLKAKKLATPVGVLTTWRALEAAWRAIATCGELRHGYQLATWD